MQDGVVQIELQLFQFVFRVYLMEQVQVFLDLLRFLIFLLYLFLKDIRLFKYVTVDEIIDHSSFDMCFLLLYFVFVYLFLEFLPLLLLLGNFGFGRLFEWF